MKRKIIVRNLFRIVLILAATALIVAFLPRESTDFSYDYTVGKPWKYGQIIASYDFPIYKTEEAIQEERDSVKKLFQPYFTYDTAEGETQIRKFQLDMAAPQLKDIPSTYVHYVINCLRDIYSQGIVESSDYVNLRDSDVSYIRVVQGTSAQIKPVSNLYTTRSAYMHILLGDSTHFSHDILSQLNINNYLSTNLTKDERKSMGAYSDLMSSVSYASGLVQSGQKIIDRGEIVTSRTVSILESMQKESIKRHDNSKQNVMIVLGQAVFVFIILLIFVLYLFLFRSDYLYSARSLLLFCFLLTLFPIATSLVEYSTPQSAYLIPYAMAPIFIRVFMDARTSFIANVVMILLCAISVREPFEFVLVQFLAGSIAIFSVKELSSRSQIFRAAVQVTLGALVFMFAYDISHGLTWKTFDASWYICIFINGILLLFTYPLMYIIERVFGFTSSVTLIELSNVNMPLLRRMLKEAQGTFNHSMQVANLASEVAAKVGANVELVRTGAFYHDIGKMNNPAFFTENQTGVNPHDSLTEERSAQIIIRHVSDGLEMADKNHLPSIIKGFIATHHGRGKTKYFYINYVNKHPGEPVNDEMFTYPGPNPSTLEQAILMMADSVEAASRSLKDVNDDALRKLVNDIIDGQVNEGNFKDCPITFHDIEIAKKQFIASLKTIYHTRISYPTLERTTENKETAHTSLIFGNYRSWNHTRRDRHGNHFENE